MENSPRVPITSEENKSPRGDIDLVHSDIKDQVHHLKRKTKKHDENIEFKEM